MAHVFFFSYARVNFDKELKAFFEDLCTEVAPYTPWASEDPQISFRDGKDLPLMEKWEPGIMDALQTSAVLVSVTSIAYFQKPFCGQEYWVFDQRRRWNLPSGAPVPDVILPVIWAPVDRGLPAFIDEIQWQALGMPAEYRKNGLRYLKRLDPNLYERCVTAFALAIKNAWLSYPAIAPLAGVPPFEQIPNAFAEGRWEEAATRSGWLPGPGVANFVFAAAKNQQLPIPAGRYGSAAAEWRPFLPPVARTISDIARAAAKKHSLRYREILINDQLATELQNARDRKNLTVVLVDPGTLEIHEYRTVGAFDTHTWEGASLLIPWNGVSDAWKTVALPSVATAFPIKSQLKPPAFLGPIYTADEFDQLLDVTLADLRGALTRAETEKKEKIDEAPAQIVGPRGSSS